MKALLVLGGPSGKNWEKVRDEINPDLIFGANGANVIPLDVWLCAENMSYPSKMAEAGEQRYIDIMEMFQRTGPKLRYVNEKSYHLLNDKTNVLQIRRNAVDAKDLKDFTFRKYGDGLIKGDLLRHVEGMNGSLRVGTVALQLIHLAGILMADEIHTVGLDLCFKDNHHWYTYPPYEVTRFFTEEMFTKYMGLNTLWFWVESAEYLNKIKPVLERDGIKWTDHSGGLLERMQ